jgi:hypothetical protein
MHHSEHTTLEMPETLLVKTSLLWEFLPNEFPLFKIVKTQPQCWIEHQYFVSKKTRLGQED